MLLSKYLYQMNDRTVHPNQNAITILVVDDHPIVRDGLVAVLSTQADFRVVGEAADGEAMIAQAHALQPHVILADLEMPKLDGVAATRAIRQALPATHVVVLTAFDTDDRIVRALEAGASGYLLKGAPRAEIFKAVRIAHAGGTLLQPLITSRLLRQIESEPIPELTLREREVLALVAAGRANKQIAAALTVTERTVKFHVSALLAKLGAANRTEAVTIARQLKLVE